MNPDYRLAAAVVERHDNLGHVRKLVSGGNADYAFSITTAWRGKPKPVMRVPVAEIPKSPIRGHGFTELAQVVNIQPKMRVVSLCCRPGLRGKNDRRDIVPPAEQVPSRLDGPSQGFSGDCPQLRLPGHQETPGGLQF